MQPQEYQTMRELEDCHWWYVVQRELVREALLRRLDPGAKLLDAGCGTGGMLSGLKEQPWTLHGIDRHPAAVQACHARGLEAVSLGDVACLPFADAEMDALLSLDVLYHRDVDETAALAEAVRVLRPGGWMILHLPAFECLRGRHDEAVCGARRYTSCHVRRMLGFHSLEVEILHPWNAGLFLPMLVSRCWSRLRNTSGEPIRSDLRLPPAWLNACLVQWGRLDALLCRQWSIPWGSSWFAVARKPHGSRMK